MLSGFSYWHANISTVIQAKSLNVLSQKTPASKTEKNKTVQWNPGNSGNRILSEEWIPLSTKGHQWIQENKISPRSLLRERGIHEI